MQRKEDSNIYDTGYNLENRLNNRGGGAPLPDNLRSFMETSFGADFSQVRTHTDAAAVQMNQELGAQAFTHGSDIYYGDGKVPGIDLLTAHELTHVVQQTRKIQRVHLENGRKKFDNPDYMGDVKLEACLNNEDRLRPFETGPSVVAVQQGLQKDGADLGQDGTSGIFGADTGKAVKAFKGKYNLGSIQYPDVGPGTMEKLDKLAASSPPQVQPPITPQLPPSKEDCGPDTNNPFCVDFTDPDTPCQPFATHMKAKLMWEMLSRQVPGIAFGLTTCSEVIPVWETYFAATSAPFAFASSSSCVVEAAKTELAASSKANRSAKFLFKEVIDNLPVTLRGIIPTPFPLGGPIAVRRLPLEEAVPPDNAASLHPLLFYDDIHNAASNLAGGVGRFGRGSDLFGDDDREMSGTVIIEVKTIDPATGMMSGQVRWQPHVHVKDTVDFCPGEVGYSFTRWVTVPMSKLEVMGLTSDVPITIDYDLDVQETNFNVIPLIGPLRFQT